MEFSHVPIMLSEVLEGLAIKPDGIYVDGTLGGAGHSSEIVKRLGDKGKLIGIDQDRDAIEAASKRLDPYKNVEIVEAHAMKDHIHMLVKIPPKLAVSSFMGYLKGKSSLMIFERHANLKYKYGNRNFWAKGYYVSTVGLNAKVVEEYIRNQEKEDMIQDNLNRKEYEDPFKG